MPAGRRDIRGMGASANPACDTTCDVSKHDNCRILSYIDKYFCQKLL